MDKSDKEDLVRGHLLVMFDQLQGHQVGFEDTVEVMTGIVREFDDILATQWAESHPLDDDFRDRIEAGERIEVIREFRSRYKCNLSWAKKVVDIYTDYLEAQQRARYEQDRARLMAERPQLLILDEFTPARPEVQRAAMQLTYPTAVLQTPSGSSNWVVGSPGVGKTAPIQTRYPDAWHVDLLPHQCFYNGVEPWRDGMKDTDECSGIKATCPRHAPNK